MERLVRIVSRLRSRNGCPWDRRQTHRSLKANLLEETYEVLDAIERGNSRDLKEELGDLLMQIVFHASIAGDRGLFDLEDVVRHVCDKLIHRHPHVFGRGRKVDAAGALTQWEILKRKEKPRRSGLAGVPAALPALLRAFRIQSKAARLGLDVAGKTGGRKRKGTGSSRAAERIRIGDSLFAIATFARQTGIDPEDALQAANNRFTRRFQRVEAAIARSGRRMHQVSSAELRKLWRL